MHVLAALDSAHLICLPSDFYSGRILLTYYYQHQLQKHLLKSSAEFGSEGRPLCHEQRSYL